MDLLRNETEVNATAKYWSKTQTLELTHVENNTGYSLQLDEKEVIKLIIKVKNFDKKYEKQFHFGTTNPKNVYVPVTHLFMSALLVKGKDNLRIDDTRYLILFKPICLFILVNDFIRRRVGIPFFQGFSLMSLCGPWLLCQA